MKRMLFTAVAAALLALAPGFALADGMDMPKDLPTMQQLKQALGSVVGAVTDAAAQPLREKTRYELRILELAELKKERRLAGWGMGLAYGLGAATTAAGIAVYQKKEWDETGILLMGVGVSEIILGAVATGFFVSVDRSVKDLEKKLGLDHLAVGFTGTGLAIRGEM
jgi:hypothetical protein